jgi:hypothetical protein
MFPHYTLTGQTASVNTPAMAALALGAPPPRQGGVPPVPNHATRKSLWAQICALQVHIPPFFTSGGEQEKGGGKTTQGEGDRAGEKPPDTPLFGPGRRRMVNPTQGQAGCPPSQVLGVGNCLNMVAEVCLSVQTPRLVSQLQLAQQEMDLQFKM